MELFLVGLFLMDPAKFIDDPEQKITFSETASNSVFCFEIEVRGKDHPRRLHVKGPRASVFCRFRIRFSRNRAGERFQGGNREDDPRVKDVFPLIKGECDEP